MATRKTATPRATRRARGSRGRMAGAARTFDLGSVSSSELAWVAVGADGA